jgi:Na+-translocating ferredoxin:NAD+ oxidoreductase RnfD subunit
MSILFEYVSPEAKLDLKSGNYKFDVVNVSVSEKLFLNPFWTFITNKIYPEWLAPNTITLLGFICMLIVQVLVWIDYPTVPRSMIWTFAVIPALMFLYQTLDGSDGKQARRTGASSPLVIYRSKSSNHW